MSSAGAPPVVPTQFLGPNYAKVDREFVHKFTIAWTSVLGFFIAISLPKLIRAVRQGSAFRDTLGIKEQWNHDGYIALPGSRKAGSRGGRLEALSDKVFSWFYWSLPGLELNLAQLLVLGGYLALVVACITVDAALVTNANRAGRIAVAQIPLVFLFATKNSLLSLVLGPGNGYEKLNFVHKWCGRGIFLGSLIHGVLWIKNHLEFDTPILGEEKEEMGLGAFALLCLIVLTSLRPVRRWVYNIFYGLHILLYVGFFITLCYHTPEAVPWIFPALAFYGLDLLLRMFRLRIKDAILVPSGQQMTLVHVQDCTDGWTAGQHVRLRVFSAGRVFESHPFTILNAPLETTCITSFPQGINLGIRVMGDWTKALNDYTRQTIDLLKKQEEAVCPDEKAGPSKEAKHVASVSSPEIPVQVMIDGPYGGCSVDLGRYESVLLFAGGAGATFTLGLLDDIVGRCVKLGRKNGEITKRIEFAWCIRSFGAIDWFAPALMDIAKVAASSDLSVHISVYVTCLCNPEAVPPIPNCDVTIVRPSIYKVLTDLVTPPEASSGKSLEAGQAQVQVVARVPTNGADGRPTTATTATTQDTSEVELEGSQDFDPTVRNRLPWIGLGGGLAVCASGPESLTREAANAVARLQMHRGLEMGIVGLHTEVFSL